MPILYIIEIYQNKEWIGKDSTTDKKHAQILAKKLAMQNKCCSRVTIFTP